MNIIIFMVVDLEFCVWDIYGLDVFVLYMFILFVGASVIKFDYFSGVSTIVGWERFNFRVLIIDFKGWNCVEFWVLGCSLVINVMFYCNIFLFVVNVFFYCLFYRETRLGVTRFFKRRKFLANCDWLLLWFWIFLLW